MIPLEIDQDVRRTVARGRCEDVGDSDVLADLKDGWILTHTSARLRDQRQRALSKRIRGVHAGAQQIVNLTGHRYRYLALLPDYEMPVGWCICPGQSPDCHCRDPKRGGAAVRLLRCERVGAHDRSLQIGERYRDAFVLAGASTTRPEDVDADWRTTLAQRWSRAHEPIRRYADDDLIVEQWGRVLDLRRRVADLVAAGLAYETVELDDDNLLTFELSDADAVASFEEPYELPGRHDVKTELRVLEQDGPWLRCEAGLECDPVWVADYAQQLRGKRRQLVLDKESTSAVLSRDEHTFRDLRTGKAHNPKLLALLANPAAAQYDSWLRIVEEPVQPDLDPAQFGAVERALRARDLLVIQGPPGTGKTMVIAELVVRHLRGHPSDTVLVASQTHQATDNVLRRIHDLEADLPFVRIAGRGQERKIASDIHPFWLDVDAPHTASVRLRAERYARFARAQARAGTWDANRVERILDIQRGYLGAQDRPAREQLLDDARVVAGTCFSVSNDSDVRERSYSLAILDEAGKASPYEALMAMLRAEKVVLVGDSRQLPPTPNETLVQFLYQAQRSPDTILNRVLCESARTIGQELETARQRLLDSGLEAPERNTAETLFNYIARRVRAESDGLEVTLRRQYRMVSGIGELIGACFYRNVLEHAGPEGGRDRRASAYSPAHVWLIDVEGHERQPQDSQSHINVKEARRAVRHLARLNKKVEALAHADVSAGGAPADARKSKPLSVAVITGYAAQLKEIKREMSHYEFPHLRVRTGLIDSFQGDEADVVIVSVVRTRRMGFLHRNRVNVALSRARSLLIVLANMEQARHGKLGQAMQDVVGYVDQRIAANDERYKLDSASRKPLMNDAPTPETGKVVRSARTPTRPRS